MKTHNWSDRKKRVVKRRVARVIKRINIALAIILGFMSVVTIIVYMTEG